MGSPMLSSRLGLLGAEAALGDRHGALRVAEQTRPRLPFAQCQSGMRHLAGIPRSTAARTAGHASRVDTKRPRILLEGINRSEYPTGSVDDDPEALGDLGRFTRLARLKSNSTRSRSAASSSFACISSRFVARHEEMILVRTEIIGDLDAPVIEVDAPGLIEIDASFANSGLVLVRIPRVLEHTPETIGRLLPTAYDWH
jgi:hypothetical protein